MLVGTLKLFDDVLRDFGCAAGFGDAAPEALRRAALDGGCYDVGASAAHRADFDRWRVLLGAMMGVPMPVEPLPGVAPVVGGAYFSVAVVAPSIKHVGAAEVAKFPELGNFGGDIGQRDTLQFSVAPEAAGTADDGDDAGVAFEDR